MFDKEFLSTSLGDLFLQKFQGLSFLSKNSDYFFEHNFRDIPESLLVQIEDFSGCEIVKSVWPTNTRFKEMTIGSSTFLNCIFTQPPFLLADLIYQKIHDGINLKILFGQNSSIPDYNDLVDKLELNKPIISKMFEKRICNQVITNVLVSDKGACLMLGNNDDITDMVNTIVGYDKNFINWCKKFFEFKWSTGEKFARLRTKS